MAFLRNLLRLALWLSTLGTVSANAADFRFVGTEKMSALRMQGPIETGDLDRLIFELSQQQDPLAAKRFFQERQILWVNSVGGSVEEALKIASFVRKSLIPVHVLGRCESACFLILAAAVERGFVGRNVGIHRPYFADEGSRSLSVEESRRRYAQMSARYYSMLEEFEVPRQITDKMRSMASSEIHYLSPLEEELMGMRQPWFEQHLIARCGLDKSREAAMFREIKNRSLDRNWEIPADYQDYRSRVNRCTEKLTYTVGRDTYFEEAELLVQRKRSGQPKTK